MFTLKALRRNKTVKYGVPMLDKRVNGCRLKTAATETDNYGQLSVLKLLVVGGSFGLREFTQIRYDAQKIKRKLDPSLEAKVNVEKQSTILEDEYEKIKDLNLDKWKNIRGPRPWEDSRDYQEQQRTRQNIKD